jgi:phosphoenolpyruvate carboxylase
LTQRISSLSVKESIQVLRAFTLYFHLVNIAEGDAQSHLEDRDTVADALTRLQSSGRAREEVLKLLGTIELAPFFSP